MSTGNDNNCRKYKFDRRALTVSLVFGLLFGAAMTAGFMTDRYGSFFQYGIAVTMVLLIVAWGCGGVISYFALTGISRILSFLNNWCGKCFLLRDLKLPTWKIWILILVFWGPVYLGVYPGFYVYDTIDELTSVTEGIYTTHHPLIHTLLLGGSVRFGGDVLNNYNYGIAVYIILQMLFVAWIFAWLIRSGGYGLLSVFWYGLFPTVVMFALCSAKDTMFATLLLATTVLLSRSFDDPSLRIYILLFSALLTMMLFRNNAVYAVAGYMVLMTGAALFTGRLEHICRLFIVILCAVATFCIINHTVIRFTGASNSEYQEMLTVPIQQMARAYNDHPSEMEVEDVNMLYEIIPLEGLMSYNRNISDNTKFFFDNEAFAGNPSKYVSLYLRMFRKYPVSYLDAWLGTGYGFYYPTVINVYKGSEQWTYTYTESSYFGYETEWPGERHSFIPILDRLYRWFSLDDDIQRIPVISLVFSMGALFWCYAFGTAYFIYSGQYTKACAWLLPICIWITFLFGPTFLPRYAVFEWFALPYLLHEIFSIKGLSNA